MACMRVGSRLITMALVALVTGCGGATETSGSEEASVEGPPGADAAVSPHCSACRAGFSKITWEVVGGGISPGRSLTACREYSRTDIVGPPWDEAVTTSCSGEAPACLDVLDDIERAVRSEEVTAALARGALFGEDRRPVDGVVRRITVDGGTFDVGDDCAGPTTSLGPACVDVPEAVRGLLDLLGRLDDAMEQVEPCATAFAR